MVATPWGDSDSLRERKLQPARGSAEAEVQKNQRERLYAAMVACVSERGLAATAVSDLLEVSGVSRRTFYEMFADKRACFVATLEATIERAVAYAAARTSETDGSEDWETRARRGFEAFAEMVAAQPAAARLCLVEIYGAGPEALERVEAAMAGVERLTDRLVEQSPEWAGMSEEMIGAGVAGLREFAGARLRERREAELPGLLDQIWDLLLSYRAPPQPLRLAVRPPRAEPEALAAADHGERAIRAFAIVVAERGYAQTSVEEVLRKAGMARATFQASFADKEDLMAAAIDAGCAQTIAAVMPAFSRATEWPHAIRVGFGAMLNFLASRPALAHLLIVEVYAAGEAAIERRDLGMAPMQMLLEQNTAELQHVAPVVYEALSSAIRGLLFETARRSGPEALPGMAPLCTYLTLAPFIGAEDACIAANGSGGGRSEERLAGDWALARRPGAFPFREPLERTAWKALAILLAHDGTPAQLAGEIEEEVVVVAEQLEKLAGTGAVTAIGEEDGEVLYRSAIREPLPRVHRMNLVSIEQAQGMSIAERRELSTDIWALIETEVERSMREGNFDRRFDRYLTRTPMQLDERGWRELASLHERMLRAGFEIGAQSQKRLHESGKPGIGVRSVQLAFEVSEERGEPQS